MPLYKIGGFLFSSTRKVRKLCSARMPWRDMIHISKERQHAITSCTCSGEQKFGNQSRAIIYPNISYTIRFLLIKSSFTDAWGEKSQRFIQAIDRNIYINFHTTPLESNSLPLKNLMLSIYTTHIPT